MWLPMTLKDWQHDCRLYAPLLGDPRLVPQLPREEQEVIRRNAAWLLAHLYKPNAEVGARGGYKPFREEPINWGDLGAAVDREGDIWVVTLEEASPEQCPLLCEYIRTWLNKWGWQNVEVKTEW